MKGYIVGFLFTLGLMSYTNKQAETQIEDWQVVTLAVIWPITLGIAAGMELEDTPPTTDKE